MLPFYPAFLAGMNLVVLADDAFSFLFAWEVMSLASWALVMAHHRTPENARAGYVYLVMASVRRAVPAARPSACWPGPHGGYAFDGDARRIRPAAAGGAWCWCWRCSAPARRPGWCRCTSGCRWPTRPRPATSRR